VTHSGPLQSRTSIALPDAIERYGPTEGGDDPTEYEPATRLESVLIKLGSSRVSLTQAMLYSNTDSTKTTPREPRCRTAIELPA